MFSGRKILFVTLGLYFFSTQLSTTSGGLSQESYREPENDDLGQILKKDTIIKYYKFVMKYYCRAVECKMEISREKIPHLIELDEFDDSKRMFALFNTRYKNLINIALQVLNEYHAAILELRKQNGLSDLQTAFYYRALQWLKYKMKIENNENNSDYKRLAEAVENNLQSDVVKNHLQDILPPLYFQLEIETYNQNTQRIVDLLHIGEYEDYAVDLFFKIKSEGMKATELVYGLNIKQAVYESILENAIPENFKEKFNIEPYEMLMYADYVHYMKNLRDLKKVFTNDLKISDIPKDSVTGWKYALICFHKYVQRLFPEHVKVDETNIKLLENLITGSNAAHKLRLQCILFLYGKIIPVIEKQMEKIDYSTPQLQINRVYYDRILAWLNHEISKEHYKSWTWHILKSENHPENYKIYDSLQDIISNLEKIIQREKMENYIIQLFSLDLTETIETIDKIEDLANLGIDESRVLVLFFYIGNFKDFIVEINDVPEWELIWNFKQKAIYEKMLQGKHNLKAITLGLTHEPATIIPLVKTNPEDFTKKFGMEPFQMLMRMDYALYSRNHRIDGMQEIYLRRLDVQYITEGTLSRWKYAMIFFHRAVEINLLNNETIDSINTKLLAYLLDADTFQKLRLSCVAFLCVHILAEIDERIQEKGVHLGDNPTPETYHEGIFELIYPESTSNGPKKWPSKAKRDYGIDTTFRDILNKIRALRVDAKDDSGSTKIDFSDLVTDLERKIQATLNP